MYNIDRIKSATSRAKYTRSACRKIAKLYACDSLPDEVINRICTRRKLYNYLEALDLNHASIESIFWSYDLPVPRDRSLKPVAGPIEKSDRPQWLERLDEPIAPDVELTENI